MNLKKLAKVELHCHLDGSVRPETMFELLKGNEAVKELSLEEFKELVMVEEDNDSLIEYLEKFKYPGKVMQEKENLERITYELLEDLNKQNIMYVEIRFAPYLHMEKGLTFDEVMNSVIKGLNRGKEEFQIDANLILIGMRHEKLEKILEMVKKGEKYLNKGVVGMDIAGDEENFPPEIHREAFLLANELGYNITIHAGETGNEKNIWTAIEELKAKRIGHGIAAIKDEKLMKELVDKKIYLEMCPTSNMQTKAVKNKEEYPIKDFMDNGIKITINTDNTTVSRTSLEKEYKFIMGNYNISPNEIVKLIENSIEASWVSNEKKDNMKERLRKSIIE